MSKIKESVMYVLPDGTDANARVLSVRTHQINDGQGGLKDVSVCDVKVMDTMPGVEEKIDKDTGKPIPIKGRVQSYKNVKEGTDPGCWHV